MRIMKQDMDAALAHLVEMFPQAFVLEKYRPHRPLKVGIAADIRERCPGIGRQVLGVVLNVYTKRVMYLQGRVAAVAAKSATQFAKPVTPGAGVSHLQRLHLHRPESAGVF
jgi:sRNA-binding protein